MSHRDHKNTGAGIGRGVLIGAALWCIVGIVALVMKSSGDARDTHSDRAHRAAPVTVDRGGETDER